MTNNRRTLVKEDIATINGKLNELTLILNDARRKHKETQKTLELLLERLGFSLHGD